MRKFRFVGNPSDYTSNFKKDNIYKEKHLCNDENITVLELATIYKKDWEEIFITDSEVKFTPIGKMRKFKYVGSKKQSSNYIENIPKIGEIYDENDCVGFLNNTTVLQWSKLFPGEWEEVFQEEKANIIVGQKEMPLHKDTDLGYYAGLIIQGLVSSDRPINFKEIVESAKELIEQLDKEQK